MFQKVTVHIFEGRGDFIFKHSSLGSLLHNLALTESEKKILRTDSHNCYIFLVIGVPTNQQNHGIYKHPTTFCSTVDISIEGSSELVNPHKIGKKWLCNRNLQHEEISRHTFKTTAQWSFVLSSF